MNTRRFVILLWAIIGLIGVQQMVAQAESLVEIDYLGESPPGDQPILFAPSVVSTPAMEYRLAMSPAGDELFFSRDGTLYRMWKPKGDSTWRGPVVPEFCGDFINGESSFSRDGTTLYFTSRRPMAKAEVALNVWYTQKTGGGWSAAKPVGPPTTRQTTHAVSIAANGNLYASGLMRYRFTEGRYSPVEELIPDTKGSHPCIAPDERFLIFGSRRVGGYDGDLYVIFRKPDGTWTDRVGLGGKN